MARDLNPGDLIITADNTAIVSRTVQSNHHDFVYNFTVANHNNYFVGKQQLWVHNTKAKSCANDPENQKTPSLGVLDSIKGTGKQVGRFDRSLKGATIEEIVSNIPPEAIARKLKPVDGKSQIGLEYKWTDTNGHTNRLRFHDPDPSHPGSNSANGWIVRWQRQGRYYDPVNDDFAHRQAHNNASPNYDPEAANNTHIPIATPDDSLISLMKTD